ncbi:serine/threonine-protein kinase [Bacillus thuringiensis]|uniref:serine/threonine-protein kinase n=1 Tax=Bacillus thuringiensis TaxID=1428 RepID=UPI002FBE6D06
MLAKKESLIHSSFKIENVDLTKLKKIGRGVEYTVYALSDELVLKVSNGWHWQNSSKVLIDLQGLPFVPKVYECGDNGEYIVMQRIYGNTVFLYARGYSWFRVQYNYETHKRKTQEFIEGCAKRGWLPRDLYGGNIMISEEGDFWIVDFGLFLKVKNDVYSSKQFQNLLNQGQGIVDAYDRIQNTEKLFGAKTVMNICNQPYTKIFERENKK